MDSYESQLNTRALDNFREYLKIQSVHPNVNYGKSNEKLSTRSLNWNFSTWLELKFSEL